LRAPADFESGFEAIRVELDVPSAFPEAVLQEAERAQPADVDRVDARDLPFVAIDPPGATDLDQAFHAEHRGAGFRVFYAIADVGAFVEPDGEIDNEARRRGTTLYSPDRRTPLHPAILSEDRASLLPGTDKPALLWTIDLDADGAPTADRIQRAEIRVREAIDYETAAARIKAPDDTSLDLLQTIGRLRQQQEAARGGVSLALPTQEVVEHQGSYDLEYDAALPIEGWNAQISLLTGIVAGRSMYDAGVGILRTLPPSNRQDLRRLRRQAAALGIDWPDDLDYPHFIRTIEPTTAAANAFLLKAARSFRGAGYVGFEGVRPKHPEHGAIASIYAHVTAPLRRLVDRFGNEILLALYADDAPPTWAVEALDELPSLMGRAKSKESALERSMIDFAETVVLAPHINEVFDGFVVDLDDRRNRATIQLRDPAVVVHMDPDGLHLAQELRLRLRSVDPVARTVDFEPVR
jgi:exoribonuclease R